MRYWLSCFLGMTLAIAVHGVGWAQTGNVDTKTQLTTDVNTNWPDNASGLITPVIARQTLLNAVQSYQQAPRIRSVSGATDTIVVDDYGKTIIYTNASVAVTLPQATTTFATFNFGACNFSSTAGSAATITPTTSTITVNGTAFASISLVQNQCAHIVSDGANYQVDNITLQYANAGSVNSCVSGSYLHSYNNAGLANCGPVLSPAFDNCAFTAAVGSNILTVSLTDAAGAAPSTTSKCSIALHPTSATSSLPNIVTVIASKTVATAVGASLGSQNNTAFRFWVLAMDDGAGSVQVGLYNATVLGGSCQTIDESMQLSSTAIGAGSTSAQTIYTTSALSNKYTKILGYLEYNSTGLATAGTYATGPNFLSLMATGTKKPCDTVQTKYATNSTAFTTASNAYQTTNLSTTITPLSSANTIIARAMGPAANNASTNTLSASIFRSSTQIGTTQVFAGSGAANSPVPFAMEAVDQPNTTGSTTYAVKIKNSDSATNVVWSFGSNQSTIVLQEIMG